MSAAAQAKRQARAEQGFELAPPRCLNCQRFDPPQHGVPANLFRPARPYKPAMCTLGGFEVRPASICDQWLGKDGAVLDEEDGDE